MTALLFFAWGAAIITTVPVLAVYRRRLQLRARNERRGEQEARRAVGMAGDHPEWITRELDRAAEWHLARWSDEAWPNEEYVEEIKRHGELS